MDHPAVDREAKLIARNRNLLAAAATARADAWHAVAHAKEAQLEAQEMRSQAAATRQWRHRRAI